MNYDPYKKEDVVKAIKREGGSSFLESQVKNPFGIHARPSAASFQ